MTSSDSISQLEQTLKDQIQRLGPHHADTRLTRDGLAIRYHNLGRSQDADALYAGDTGVCEHLLPALEYLRSLGVSINSISTPWSRNCRHWIYFRGVVLDPDALKSRLKLADCVQAYVHRGTHDGAEQGLVCSVHHDGLMGAHPEVTGGAAVRVIG